MANIICPQCKTENPENAKFCLNCGFNLGEVRNSGMENPQNQDIHQNQSEEIDNSKNQQVSSNYQNIPVNFQQNYILKNLIETSPQLAQDIELWSAYVQTKLDYYIPKFVEFRTLDKKASWNWPAFFFTPLWFAYRKMLGYGVLVMVLSIIPLVGLIVSILSGIYGNYIYYKKVNEEVQKAIVQSKYLNTDPRIILAGKGGTSIANLFILFGIAIIISIIYAVFMAAIEGGY
ncbi:zinc-ribbon domain-containing protein [Persephonella sp.]|uniref:zinc-ribbon domain-containing protein n=1 Tax=Persephonella sp. TaxID=2060922 RepID=UPI0026020D7D|nr:zinc-ribbon domain-containing protein [Persephonella sp.]